MTFMQIIEFHTSKFDEVEAIGDEWEAATEGKRTARRQIVAHDRNDPTRHLIFAFFDSYESAMLNSQLPETEEFAARYGAVVDGPMVFHDLDIVKDEPL